MMQDRQQQPTTVYKIKKCAYRRSHITTETINLLEGQFGDNVISRNDLLIGLQDHVI